MAALKYIGTIGSDEEVDGHESEENSEGEEEVSLSLSQNLYFYIGSVFQSAVFVEWSLLFH